MDPKGPELYEVAKGNLQLQTVCTTADLRLRQVTCGGNTILHVAANFRNKKTAEQVLNLDQSLLFKANNKGDTPLHIAARLGDSEMASLLIDHTKEDVVLGTYLLETENMEKDTALHVAVRYGHHKIVKLLIEKDPKLALMTNKAEESPLFLAVDRKFYNIALTILTLPECSPRGRKKMNALHAVVIRTQNSFLDFAIEENHFKPFNYLRKVQNLIKCIDSVGEQEQPYNVDVKRIEFVKLVMGKCTPTAADAFGWIPLHYAAHLGDVELVELFLKNDKSLAYVMDEEGMSALHISAKKGHVGVMRAIITRCPDTCELLDKSSRTALHLAVESGKVGPVKFLLQLSEFQNLINEQDREGNTPLHLAATRGYIPIVRSMSKFRKVDTEIMNNADMTPLEKFRSVAQQNLASWLTNELRIERLVWVFISRIYRSSLEGLASKETREAHAIGTSGQGHDEETKIKKELTMSEVGSCSRANNIGGTNHEDQNAQKQEDKHESMSETFLLIATINATVTFQAAFQIPGGYDNNGQPILSKDAWFQQFLIQNSISLSLSAFIMSFHFFVAFFPQRFQVPYPRPFIFLVTQLGLSFMMSAFWSSLLTQKNEAATLAVTLGILAAFIPVLVIVVEYTYFISKRVSKSFSLITVAVILSFCLIFFLL